MASLDWVRGIRAALPIVVGYVPAAVAFGVAARQAGLSVAETVLMSVIVYAGASQFALAGMIGSGMPAAAAAVTGLVLNVRHVLYGPALAPWLPRSGRGTAAVGSFGLTDEVFAVASAVLPRERASWRWLFGLEAAAYGSWVAGTWLGAAGGQAAVTRWPAMAQAMSFALPALFLGLLIPMLASPTDAPAPEASDAGPSRSSPQGSATREARGVWVSAAVGGVVAILMWLAGWARWSVLAAGVLGPMAGLVSAGLPARAPVEGPPGRRTTGAEGGLEEA